MSFCLGFSKTAADVIHMGEWLKKHPHYRVEKKIQKMHQTAAPKLKAASGVLRKYAPYAGLAGLAGLAAYGAHEPTSKKK